MSNDFVDEGAYNQQKEWEYEQEMRASDSAAAEADAQNEANAPMGSVREEIARIICWNMPDWMPFEAFTKEDKIFGLKRADQILSLVCKRIEGAMLEPERRVKVTDKALKAHYRETMETSRVPSDYILMMTEGGDADAVAYANCFTQLQAILDVISPTGGKIG